MSKPGFSQVLEVEATVPTASSTIHNDPAMDSPRCLSIRLWDGILLCVHETTIRPPLMIRSSEAPQLAIRSHATIW
jgi:hypothetical protein